MEHDVSHAEQAAPAADRSPSVIDPFRERLLLQGITKGMRKKSFLCISWLDPEIDSQILSTKSSSFSNLTQIDASNIFNYISMLIWQFLEPKNEKNRTNLLYESVLGLRQFPEWTQA